MVFDFVYDVPRFVILVVYWYQNVQGLSGISLVTVVLLPYILAAAILALVAKRLTARIEVKGEEPKGFSFDLKKEGLMKMIKPAMYEITLILVVLFFLYLAEFFVVERFQ